MSTKLPLKKFGEVCTFVRGPFGGSLKKSEFKESGYVVYEQQHAIGNQFSQVRYYIDDEKFNDMKRFELLSGDLIMSCSGTMGRVAIVPNNIPRGIINQALLKLTPSNNLDVNYLQYWMESNDFQESIAKFSVGAAIKNVASVKILKQIDIPLPPLPEQKQIVQTLDRAFAQLDLAKTHLEKNLHNAQELFASKLNEVFSQRGEGWVEKRLGEITTKIGSGSTPRGGQASYKESGISLIRSMNVHDDGFREKKLAFIDDEQALKLKNVTLEKEDILLNITGASVARCCIVPDNYLPARVNQHVSIIRLEKNILHPSYLHYCLTAQENKNKLLNIGRQGATREAITKVQIENFVVFYPSDMNEQLEVINELNIIKEKSEQLQTYYQQKLTNLEELKKSILEKAFRGEL